MSAARTIQMFGDRRATMGARVLLRVGGTLRSGEVIEIDTVNDVPKKVRCLGLPTDGSEDAGALSPVFASDAIDPNDLPEGQWMWPLDP